MSHAYAILSRERAIGRRQRLDRIRLAMTPDQVRCDMARIIKAKLELNEDISLDDFRLANLPMDIVQVNFKAILRIVQNTLAAERT